MKIGIVITGEVPDDGDAWAISSAIVASVTSALAQAGLTPIKGVSPATLVIEDSLERVIKSVGGEAKDGDA